MTVLSGMPGLACVGWCIVCGLVWSYRPNIRGSTLVGPWLWGFGFAAAMAHLEMLHAVGAIPAGMTGEPWRVIAGNLGLCPILALLGAKRPQSKAWFWIVLSFWSVICIPAWEALIFHPGGTLDITGVRGYLPWFAIGIACVNYLGTPRAWRALLAHLAIFVVIRRELPGVAEWDFAADNVLAPLAMIVALLPSRPWTDCSPDTTTSTLHELEKLNRQWRNFRDAYGGIWALRVLERLNHAVVPALAGWQWSWNGLVRPPADKSNGPPPRRLTRAQHALLGRFLPPAS